MSISTVALKRGATFRASFRFDFDLSGYEIQATVSNGVTDVDELTTRIIDNETGWIEIEASASLTQLWPVRLLRADMKCTLVDEVVQSETFYINVLPEIT